MSGRRYDGLEKAFMGWSTARAQVTFVEGVTVSFNISGQRSKEEASEHLDKENKRRTIRIQDQVIIQL